MTPASIYRRLEGEPATVDLNGNLAGFAVDPVKILGPLAGHAERGQAMSVADGGAAAVDRDR